MKIIAVDLQRKIIGKINVSDPQNIPPIAMIGAFSKRVFIFNKITKRFEETAVVKGKIES